MQQKLQCTVLSDLHYCSKKNWVDGFSAQQPPRRDQLFFSASTEIVDHTFRQLCRKDTPEIVLISGDLIYNGDRNSHQEMHRALQTLQDEGKRVFVITATHDYASPQMPTYGFDRNDRPVPVKAVPREELLQYYGDFGYNSALAVHPPTMSYVAQLTPGCRLLAINDDYGDPHCGFSPDCMDWIACQTAQAKEEGQFLLAMTHHPLVPPSPLFAAVAPGDMLDRFRQRRAQLAKMGIRLILTGHTHMHNIACVSVDGDPFYDISTAALTGFPPAYRTLCIDPDKAQVQVRTHYVDRVPGVNTHGLSLADYTKDLFFGTIADALDSAMHDYPRFMDFAAGMSLSKEVTAKYKPLFAGGARFLNRLTFGKVWRWVHIGSGISKAEIRPIAQKKVVPYVIDIAANLYRGDGAVPQNSPEYKLTVAVLRMADRMTKPFAAKLRATGIDSISTAVLPLVHKTGIPDGNATLYI